MIRAAEVTSCKGISDDLHVFVTLKFYGVSLSNCNVQHLLASEVVDTADHR